MAFRQLPTPAKPISTPAPERKTKRRTAQQTAAKRPCD
ncbi:hypothetical protein SAMN05443668_101206 [Cryptosporangium aurantiacum]|uniref:Uncharacterized protein n=1 Tax=Cryptosporangium aurantiacum TaxID=134849 RepID=A0A1M7HJ79_9ACTN|nr:hypothetical protein SAMN05443668_101206 [Cryptosporangium aurantiacum]